MINFSLVRRPNPQNRTEKKWYATPRIAEHVYLKDIAKQLSRESTVSRGDVYAVLEGAIDVINQELSRGNKIHLGSLGELMVRFRSKGAEKEEEFHPGLIYGQYVKLYQGEDLKKELPFLKYKKVDPHPQQSTKKKKTK